MPRPPHLSQRRQKQQGLAAIEFALIAIIMVVMLLGSLVYWRAFQAQQSLTRAAGDGARAVLSMVSSGIPVPCHPDGAKASAGRALIEERMQTLVIRSLEQSGMPGKVSDQLSIGALQWLNACPSSGEGSVSFELSYELPPLLGGSGQWIAEPRQLSEKSVVHFASML